MVYVDMCACVCVSQDSSACRSSQKSSVMCVSEWRERGSSTLGLLRKKPGHNVGGDMLLTGTEAAIHPGSHQS